MTHYYQLGGFRPSFHWFKYDDRKLASAIAGDESPLRQQDSKQPVELALGIRTSGASCLLLTEGQVRKLTDKFPSEPFPRFPLRLKDFESVSPISFHTADDLKRKLAQYTPKKTKKSYDTSQANRAYAPIDGRAEIKDGPSRASFEHNRLLYRLLHRDINHAKFSLDEGCIIHASICALAFNTWSMDKRPPSDLRRSPKILDLGLTTISGQPPNLADRTSYYFVDRTNQNLDAAHRKEFTKGRTETLEAHRLKDIIKGSTEKPLILMVADMEATCLALESLGLNTSGWTRGIKTLVYNMQEASSPPYRRRSRSPSRPSYSSSSSRSRTLHTSSPVSYTPPSSSYTPFRQTYNPIYIVDIKEMYVKMRQTTGKNLGLYDIAKYTLRQDFDNPGFCAGNESSLLIDIWESLSKGSPIDEQRAERPILDSQSNISKLESKAEEENPLSTSNSDEDDEDWDPNDVMDDEVARMESGTHPVSYDSMYNDDDDYGDDDD